MGQAWQPLAPKGPWDDVDLLDQAGQACAMKDGFLRPTSVPECPDIRVLRREYYQLNNIGRAVKLYEGNLLDRR